MNQRTRNTIYKEDIETHVEMIARDLEKTVELSKTLNMVLGGLIYVRKPTELFSSKKYLKRVSKAKPVKELRAPVIELDIEESRIDLPYSYSGYGRYTLRTYYSYRVNIEKKVKPVRIIQKKKNVYLAVGDDFADEFPPKSLRGWIYVSSLIEDEDFKSIISDKVPYEKILSELVRETPSLFSGQYLGSVLSIETDDVGVLAVFMKDEYVNIGKLVELETKTTMGSWKSKYRVIDYVMIRIGDVQLVNPSRGALKPFIIHKIRGDVMKIKETLLKLVIGCVNFVVARKEVELGI